MQLKLPKFDVYAINQIINKSYNPKFPDLLDFEVEHLLIQIEYYKKIYKEIIRLETIISNIILKEMQNAELFSIKGERITVKRDINNKIIAKNIKELVNRFPNISNISIIHEELLTLIKSGQIKESDYNTIITERVEVKRNKTK